MFSGGNRSSFDVDNATTPPELSAAASNMLSSKGEIPEYARRAGSEKIRWGV